MMERLTKRSYETTHENGVCCTHFGSPECCEVCGNCALNCKWEEAAWSRLAAYEDTRLTPEEVLPKDNADEIAMKLLRLEDLESFAPYERLRKLAEADKDGRLVVLDEPMRPLVWGDKEHDTILCPRCLCDLMGGFEYAPSCETVMFQCPHCGQPIKSDKAIDMEQSEAEASLALKGGEGL